MSTKKKFAYTACFFCHIAIIGFVCLRDLVAVYPARSRREAIGSAENRAITYVSPAKGSFSFFRVGEVALRSYENCAGIESGYSFFAPNIPDSSKLLFELHYANGRIEYELPSVNSNATGLRLSGLLDGIERMHHPVLREAFIQVLAHAEWQEHPDASLIRALFGYIKMPSAREFRKGQKESFVLLASYDFKPRLREGDSR